MITFTVRWNPGQEDRQDLYVKLSEDVQVLVAHDITPGGVDWACDEMALLDDGDRQQVEAVAADVRKRMPVRYLWAWIDAERRRLDNLPRRGALGRFKTQGAH